MKIERSHYQLQPVNGSQRTLRKGALLRVMFEDGSVGYGDCHPWHELGDDPLDLQLKKLAEGTQTYLIARSLAAARLDATARQKKQHLFTALEIPISHHHISDLTLSEGENFERCLAFPSPMIKIKVGIDLAHELKVLQLWSSRLINAACRLRLDFNCRITEKAFLDFWQAVPELHACFDFFEDPFTFHPQKWEFLRQKYGMRFACDRESFKALAYPHSCDVLVVKPAIQDVNVFLHPNRGERTLVITSYVDHPIGQLTAAYAAANLMKHHPEVVDICGLLTHHAFKPTVFSREFTEHNGCLIPSLKGDGWGYNQLLEELPWQKL